MKNLERLLDIYQKDKRSQTICNQIESTPGSRILLKGTVGALDSFVIAATYKNLNRTHLIIAEDKEQAAYLHNSTHNILQKKQAYFFPDSFKRPTNFEKINSSNILERTRSIHKASNSSSKGELIFTYPEAIFEKVVDPKLLNTHRIEIVKGESVDIPSIIEVLVEFGFYSEEFVYEPGQFSVRGGIVDIYSYGNEYPYRIELFDDEVESIRTFNPATQLSVRNIESVEIIPNINTEFSAEEKVSVFDVIPKDTVLWIGNIGTLVDRLQICFDKAETYAQNISVLDESDHAELFRNRAFLLPGTIFEKIEPFTMVCFSKSEKDPQFDATVNYIVKPQPSFNKNFDLLIKDLQANKKKRIENYLFTDNPRQIERFYSIFEDLNADVHFHPIAKSIFKGFIDLDLNVACYTDHQIFERFHRYKLKQGFTKQQSLNVRLLRELQVGDFVTHIDHGVGKYSGLQKIDINGHVQESVRLIYKNNDILYVSINSLHKISKYVSKDATNLPKLSKLGSDAWKTLKRKTKKKVKDIATELIKLYAKRKASEGFPFPEDGYLQNELEASFIYEDTPDQYKATQDVKEDMMKPYPMDRLICGDVGFGKTEIAIRAAFKAIVGGKQVAILVPTTILALQHYNTFSSRLKAFDLNIDYVNRFRTAKEKRIIYEKLKAGEIDLVIGTHSLLNKQVGFKDLGLLVIDEEQKFGVAAKEKLRNIKVNVDTLTLTATPIPRTLQFSLMNARDLSIIRTPPPNRQPIHTEVRTFNDDLVKESVYFEVNRGGQVFFVHNRVNNLQDIAAMVKRLCPDVDVGVAHGQMDPKKLEQALLDFIDHKYDVLICTNIIETGLDIPSANTMIINNAHQFGMSDLHQLRGRVGRSNKKAYCYLFSPPPTVLTSEARKRLKTLEEFSDLGSGFNIAMKDLDIRGAGNLLGAEQSGFIADIGYETYQKILEEAVLELKETDFKELFKEDLEKKRQYVRDVQVDTDVEMLIPNEYVSSIQERLSLYTRLDKLETEEQIEEFTNTLRDRFGKVPHEIKELFEGLRLRWTCKQLGFERLILKNNKLRCYFVENPQSSFFESDTFNTIVQYVTVEGFKKGLSFKKSHKHFIMIKSGVKSLKQANNILKSIENHVNSQLVS
ncbi:MAG: transcription-repair coupling factor [Bacteroidota bacterium]